MKIRFTSGEEEPSPDDWKSVYFEPGGGNSVMRHCVVEYGGKDSSWGLANVCVDEISSVTLDNLTIRRSSGDGLNVKAQAAPRISKCIITESAARVTVSTPNTVSGWVRFASIPNPMPSNGANFFTIAYRPIGQRYDALTLGIGVNSRTLFFDI